MSTTEHLFFQGVVALSPRKTLSGSLPSSARLPVETIKDEFLLWLFEQAKLSVEHYRVPSLIRRIPACLRHLGADDRAQARQMIEARPDLVQTALDVILLGVTEFCRDREVFHALRAKIIPDLLSRYPSPRIWSAACSDGHELYSIAMLLDEAGSLAKSHLLGTDCRTGAITRAREARFDAGALADLDTDLRDKYFKPTLTGYRINSTLHSSVIWKAADLLAGAEDGPWHMILWRNMAIYLNSMVADIIWNRLYEHLQRGGYLITGKADHPPASLHMERISPCVFRKN